MSEKPLVIIDLDLTARTWLEHLCPSPVLTHQDYNRYLKHPQKFELEQGLRTRFPAPRRGLTAGIRKVLEFLTHHDIPFKFVSYLDPTDYADTIQRIRERQSEWLFEVVDVNFDSNTSEDIFYSFTPDYSAMARPDRILIDSSRCRCATWAAKGGKSIYAPYTNGGEFAVNCLKELLYLRP